MAGIVGMGIGTRNTALSGLKRSANMEEARENTNKMLDENHKNTQKSSIGSGVASGAMIGAQVGGPWGAVIGGVLGGVLGWGASS